MAKKPTKVVQAVGHAGGGGKPGLAQAIDAAMAQATLDAAAAGIVDQDAIRDLKLKARKEARENFEKSSSDGAA